MRYWEIDFARGVAVILMLFYHVLFDAHYFGKLELPGTFCYLLPRFIVFLFVFISGLSLGISCSKKLCTVRVLKKSLKLGFLAVMITILSRIFLHEGFIIFGILHFFAVATPLGLLFVRRPQFSILMALLILLISMLISHLRVSFPWLLWLGVIPSGFYTLDYIPLIPWFGIFLLGIFFSEHFRSIGDLSFPLRSFVELLGRNSLKIYLVQHPVIVILLDLLYGDIIDSLISEVF